MILHLTTYLQGGAGRAITDLACAQHAAGHRVSVVTSIDGVPGYGNYPEYLERLAASGVALYQFDSLFNRDLARNLQVVSQLREVGPVEIVHAHAGMPALIGRLLAGHAARRVPLIQTQHGWGTCKTPAQAQMDLAILRDVDRVVTTSRSTRDLLVGLGTPGDSVSVIPCGIEASYRPEPSVEARECVASLRRRGLRVVGCIGSVNANKNQRLLVEALARVPHAAGVFVGEGGGVVPEAARAHGVEDRVVACGYQPRAAEWLPLFDALVIPSRTEGQGLVALEAFRAGVPVVASGIPALAELIEDRASGFLFESDDATALCAALARALSMDDVQRGAVVASARRRFMADFTIEKMMARHEELYKELGAGPAEAGHYAPDRPF